MQSENVSVAVRIRPQLPGEDPSCVWMDEEGGGVTTMDPQTSERRRFAFDKAFSDRERTEKVYKSMASGLLEKTLAGYNVTLLAYGQTGSGKTHTVRTHPQLPFFFGFWACLSTSRDRVLTGHSMPQMFGSENDQGIVPMFTKELASRIGSGSVSMSMLEVYNENPRDLLAESNCQEAQCYQRPLKIREDPSEGPYAEGLTWHKMNNWDAASRLLGWGNANKAIGVNDVHSKSSRSHTIVQMKVKANEVNAATGATRTLQSRVNFVDLAGSERASATHSRFPQAAIEGKYINRSLSALGKCVRALADRRKEQHVPFRDSVLTWLLKHSLAGNARTAVVATVSPDASDYAQTLACARFVDKMQHMETAAVVNEDRRPLQERGNNQNGGSNNANRGEGNHRRRPHTPKYYGVGGRWIRGKGFVKGARLSPNKLWRDDESNDQREGKRQRVEPNDASIVRDLPESPSPASPRAKRHQKPLSREAWPERSEEAMQHSESGASYLRRLEEDILNAISTTSLPSLKPLSQNKCALLGLNPSPPQARGAQPPARRALEPQVLPLRGF